MNTEPKIFANSKCFKLAESPMWHKRQQALYWRGYHGEIYRKCTPENPDDFECFQLDIGKTVFVTTGCASTGQVGFDGGVFAFRTDIPGAAEYLFPLS